LTYLYDEVTDGERALLRNTVTRLGLTTPQKVLEACSSNVWEQARLLNAFWHLVATAEIATDLDIKLTMVPDVRLQSGPVLATPGA
jgi:TnsA endonuclease-like protein